MLSNACFYVVSIKWINEILTAFFPLEVLKVMCIFYNSTTSQLTLAIFQLLSDRLWLVAVILNIAAL